MLKFKRYSVESERLLLRPFNGCDLNPLIPLANDFEIAKNLALMPYPYTTQYAEEFLETVNEMGEEGAIFAIELKETSALIGCCGYGPCSDMVARENTIFRDSKTKKNVSEEEFDRLFALPDLGYWLGKAYWGKGYATEAAYALAGHAFEVLNFEALGSAFHKPNAASGRVLEKVGFEIIGEEKQHSLGAGTLLDTWLLELPKERWLKNKERWLKKGRRS